MAVSITIKKITALIMCSILSVSMLSGCSGGTDFMNLNDDEEHYTLSDKITIPVKILRDINPATSSDADVYQVCKLTFDSLISLTDNLTPEADLADSWQFSDDRSSITFNLRSGIEFSDGSSFGADDVVFSFKAYQSASSPIFGSKINRISGVSSDGNSVTFKIKDSGNITISDFDFPIFSSKQFSSVSEFLKAKDKPLIGTGAYKMDSVDLDKKIELSANEYYWGSKPENNITLQVFSVDSLFPGLVNVGDISVSVYTSEDRDSLKGDSELNVTSFTSNQFETIGYNCASGPMADVNLRKAVSYMIDRKDILNSAYYNGGTINDDLFFPGYYGTEVKKYYSKDADNASDYLKEAGFAQVNSAGFVQDSDGNRLSLKLLVNADNPMRLNAANMIASDLFDNGIQVNISQVSSESYEAALRGGDFDMFVGGWKLDENMDLRKFYHSGFSNYAHYSNDKADKLLDSLMSGPDEETTKKTVEELKDIFKDDVPYLCIMYKTYAAVTSVNLQGTLAPRFNNYYYACEDWKIKLYDSTISAE